MMSGTSAPPFMTSSPSISALLKMNTINALQVHANAIALGEAYEGAIKAMIFGLVETEDKKAERAHQKTLLSGKTFPILLLLWKESTSVSDPELLAAGLVRSFVGNQISPHRLAIAISGDSAVALPATIKKIARIVDAGVFYGLIKREVISSTRTAISGTSQLHELMLRIAADQSEILNKQMKLMAAS